jgi:uncharacterized protein with HEPN domain
MDERTGYRLKDILDAIEQIELLLGETSFANFVQDRIKRAAFERFLEIISEASRYIPEDFKAGQPNIPWRRIADTGNHLRHAYHRIDPEVLWDVYRSGELAELKSAVESMHKGK